MPSYNFDFHNFGIELSNEFKMRINRTPNPILFLKLTNEVIKRLKQKSVSFFHNNTEWIFPFSEYSAVVLFSLNKQKSHIIIHDIDIIVSGPFDSSHEGDNCLSYDHDDFLIRLIFDNIHSAIIAINLAFFKFEIALFFFHNMDGLMLWCKWFDRVFSTKQAVKSGEVSVNNIYAKDDRELARALKCALVSYGLGGDGYRSDDRGTSASAAGRTDSIKMKSSIYSPGRTGPHEGPGDRGTSASAAGWTDSSKMKSSIYSPGRTGPHEGSGDRGTGVSDAGWTDSIKMKSSIYSPGRTGPHEGSGDRGTGVSDACGTGNVKMATTGIYSLELHEGSGDRGTGVSDAGWTDSSKMKSSIYSPGRTGPHEGSGDRGTGVSDANKSGRHLCDDHERWISKPKMELIEVTDLTNTVKADLSINIGTGMSVKVLSSSKGMVVDDCLKYQSAALFMSAENKATDRIKFSEPSTLCKFFSDAQGALLRTWRERGDEYVTKGSVVFETHTRIFIQNQDFYVESLSRQRMPVAHNTSIPREYEDQDADSHPCARRTQMSFECTWQDRH